MFVSESLEVIVFSHLFLPFDSWTHMFWLWEKQHHTLDTDSKHTQPSEEPCPTAARYFQLAVAITEAIFKRSFHHSIRYLLQDSMRNMLRSLNFMSTGLLPQFWWLRQLLSLDWWVGSVCSVEPLNKGMIHVLGGFKWDNVRFYHATQKGTQFKT